MVQGLEIIHGQTGVEFIYSSKAQLRQKVSLNIEKERLEITLDRLLDPVGLTYEVVGQNIVITRRNRRVGLIPLDLPAVKLQNLHLLPSAVQDIVRSEEHTSELQSLMRTTYAVFCLKKKT